MKRTIRLSFALAALVSLSVACGDLVEIPQPGENQGTDTPGEEQVDGTLTFNATTEDLAAWKKGDRVSVFDGKSVLTGVNAAEDGTAAKFELKVAEGAEAFLAFYPAVSQMSATEVQGELPGVQIPVAESWDREAAAMIAKSSTSRLYFRNLMATLSVVLDMDDAASVMLTSSNGAKLSGAYTVDYSSDVPVVSASSSAAGNVSLQGAMTRGTTYNFVVLPGKIEGYTLVVKNSKGEEIAHNASSTVLELAAGTAAELGTIKSDSELPKTYKISHMWLWGGTGAEYDCSKLWDLFAKAGCFDSTDGRGVEALKDDVLELHADGTFRNWAGEDGRHWWMAFDKSQTPSKYKSLDMSKFYAVLPKNEGSYSIDGNTIKFTDEKGKETTGTIVGPGTYELPGCSPAKSVTITTMAVKFVITGGVDDWDHSWDDYGVFYRKPRQLYIELDQMPAGYVTPESAKTTDTVVFVEPDDPKPEFDITTLPGSYKVSDLRVLGGSGDDPAFVDPKDKSWCFDSTLNNEYDNCLEVTTTTLNYWSGDDGKFWDYKYHGGQADEVDMSHVYGILPRGVVGFTLNTSTMEAVINGSVKATLLIPGTHHFTEGNRDLMIDNGCFGICFHIMDPIAATDKRWTDIDRFVNAPIKYVMIFKKK